MKPKNRVMCPDCGKPKMFFESESKANNFIKFNKDDIKNGDELRSYYCPACCGWHVSHKQYKQILDNNYNTDRLINAYERSQQKWPITYDKKIIELYDIMSSHPRFLNRKQVNEFLRTLDYSEFIKYKARVRYYTEHNL